MSTCYWGSLTVYTIHMSTAIFVRMKIIMRWSTLIGSIIRVLTAARLVLTFRGSLYESWSKRHCFVKKTLISTLEIWARLRLIICWCSTSLQASACVWKVTYLIIATIFFFHIIFAMLGFSPHTKSFTRIVLLNMNILILLVTLSPNKNFLRISFGFI